MRRLEQRRKRISSSLSNGFQLEFMTHICRVTEGCARPESVEFMLAVESFKSYVAGRYQIEAAKNTGNQFLSQLFKDISLKSLRGRPLFYVVLVSILIEVDFCPKLTKVNRILNEIVHLPPSSNPTVFRYLDRIVKWMTRPLGASVHMLVLPLRDSMVEWFKAENEEVQISGLYLLRLFIRRFPNYLNPVFETAKMVILRALKGNSREAAKAAAKVITSALDLLGTVFSSFVISVCQMVSAVMCDIGNPVSEIYIKAMYSIVNDDPRALPLLAPNRVPIHVFWQLSTYHLLDVIHLAYICCPDMFTGENFNTIFDGYHQLLEANMESINGNFLVTLKSLGMFCFCCSTLIQNQFLQQVDPLKTIIKAHLEISEAKYAYLSLMSPRDIDCDGILGLILDGEMSDLVLKGLAMYCQKWPVKGPFIRSKLLPFLCSLILEQNDEDTLNHALKYMRELAFTPNEITLTVLLQISKRLLSPSISVRERTAKLLLSQQENFPKITVRLLTWIGTEVNNKLRVKILKKVRIVGYRVTRLLFTLVHERQPDLRQVALELLNRVKLSRRMVTGYLSEIIADMEQRPDLDKCAVNSMLIILKEHKQWVKPYAGYLVERFLDLPAQKACSLLLMSEILTFAGENINGKLPEFVSHLTMNISRHVSLKRLKTALELMKSGLRYTYLVQIVRTEYPNLLNRLFEIASSEMAPDVASVLLEVMERFGPINVGELRKMVKSNRNSVSTSSLISAFVLTKSKPTINSALTALTNLSVVRALTVILDIMEEDSLMHLHNESTQALLAILSDYRNVGDEVRDMILEKINCVLVNGGSTTIGLVIPLLTCFGNKIAPMMPHIIDLICENWDTLDLSVLLKIIQWISVQIPEVFVPHVHKVVSLLVSSIDMLENETAKDIFVTLVSLEDLIQYVDFLIVPVFLQWLEVNCASTDVANDALICFKAILVQCRSSKFCCGIIRTLLLICKRNKELIGNSLEIVLVLAVQMRDGLIVYLQEISQVFDVSDNDEFNVILHCVRHSKRIPAALVNKYDAARRQVKREPFISHRRQESADRQMMKELPKLENPSSEWEEFQWDNWYEELVSSFIGSCPSKAVACCAGLAKSSAVVRNSLFPVAYALYVTLDNECERRLISILKETITAKNARSSIVRSFLSIVEHLEINKIDLHLPWSLLAAKATATGQYTQALRYHEYDFDPDNQEVAEKLIMLNLRLGLRLAANGILKCAHVRSETFEEYLGLWDNALKYYEEQLKADPTNTDHKNGKMRALDKLCRYCDLAEFCQECEPNHYMASAAFHLFNHEWFIQVVSKLDETKPEAMVFCAIGEIMKGDYNKASELLDSWNHTYASRIFPMNLDDCERMESDITLAAVVSELFDVIELKKSASDRWSAAPRQRKLANSRFKHIMRDWVARFEHMKGSPKFMFDALCIRSLALTNEEITPFWLQFIDKEMVNGRTQMLKIALDHVDHDLPEIQFAECVLKRKFDGENEQAVNDLKQLVETVQDQTVRLRCLSQLSDWYLADGSLTLAYDSMKEVIEMKPQVVGLWKKWVNLCLRMYQIHGEEKYVKLSIKACFSGLKLDKTLSFALLILSIGVKHESQRICKALQTGFKNIVPDIWISLLPQITAMLKMKGLRSALIELLRNIAKARPNTIVYALMTSFMENEEPDLLSELQSLYPTIVNTSIRFSHEMVRIASTWWESWYNAIDDASKRYVYHNDLQATIKTLLPLHQKTDAKAKSLFEIAFTSLLGPSVVTASEYLNEYAQTGNIMYFNQAWTIYVSMFKKIRNIVKDLTSVDLRDVSPWLANLHHSSLVIPGTALTGNESITIESIGTKVPIMRSKQRPRRVDMLGSDGNTYHFLLKANEDTRLDERVMQLFDFISGSIKASAMPLSHNLAITTYRVLPFTYKVGLIGWVPNTQTLLEIIRQYRASNSVVLEIEKLRTYVVEPKYDEAPLERKIAAFKAGLNLTSGDDLQKVILCYSTDCNDWLNRRINYTTSLAVTSIAGYILGLGDRHVCNIMMNTRTAKLVHIDFGDSFEVAMHRANWPEKVPFRLTRMMVQALEVSRIEGTLRATMENVMSLIRDKGDQILALIEAWMCSPVQQMLDTEKMFKMSHRIEDKLKGTDFGTDEPLSVPDQVERLIKQATDISNLAQMFTGWYPWW